MNKRRAHEFTVAKKQAGLDRSRLLLRRYPVSLVHSIWFTDEKLFTVASYSNTQNDGLYVAVGTRKRYGSRPPFRTRPTLSKSLTVSIGVSSLGRTSIHFVEPGVKIDGQYYRDVLLMEDLLPEIREFSEFYISQQDGAHRARETVTLLTNEIPDFINPTLWVWPPNIPALNLVDYK